MKLLLLIIFSLFLFNCSFDKKTGIWENSQKISNKDKNNDIFKDFKKVSIKSDIFSKTIILDKNTIIKTSNSISNSKWSDVLYANENNLDHFKFNNLNKIDFKSKKITKHTVGNYKLFDGRNLLINDDKGNIIIFSIDENRVVSKFNFYKNKYKRIKKKLFFYLENETIFVSDNLGFLYALDYMNNKVLWAKNLKIPFRSNMKILNNKIFVSNQNNSLQVFNKYNGDLIKSIPTEEISIKNNFLSNLSIINKEKIIFLNSYGSLYSVDNKSLNIDWFLNLNQSLDVNTSNLFSGNIIVSKKNEIIISSKDKTYFINAYTGLINKKFNFSTSIRPIIVNDLALLVSKNNYLIAINLTKKNIIYSYNLNDIKKFNISDLSQNIYKQIMLLSNKIFIYLKNSHIIILNINGEFKSYQKLPSKMVTSPISIEDKIFYLNNKNKLIVLN